MFHRLDLQTAAELASVDHNLKGGKHMIKLFLAGLSIVSSAALASEITPEPTLDWGRTIERECSVRSANPFTPCGPRSRDGNAAEDCAYRKAQQACRRMRARYCDYVDSRFEKVIDLGGGRSFCSAIVIVEAN